jgi:ring-1,2-phenylacetyl-CoA epoxidase subunit PaaD
VVNIGSLFAVCCSLPEAHRLTRTNDEPQTTNYNYSMAATRDEILDVLRTIPDPEMPISIVDLGIVQEVRVAPLPPGSAGGWSRMGSCESSTVRITILPTFIGCPALDMIRDEIVKKVGALEGVDGVEVEFINDPPWSVDRISEEGRASLRAHGVTVLSQGLATIGATMLRTSAIPCPFCGSDQTRLDSPFGPTRCRSIYYCESCRNSFEHMKRV